MWPKIGGGTLIVAPIEIGATSWIYSMKFALPVSRREHILAMLTRSLTGLTVVFILTLVMTVVHSGLLIVE